MRIAVFTELYAPSVGGQEMFFAGLAKALMARGHTLEVFCIGHQKGLAAREDIGGVAVHRHPVVSNYTKPWLAVLQRKLLAVARYAFYVRGIARRGEHDFYLLNEWPIAHAVLLPRQARRRALLHWCEIHHSVFILNAQRKLPGRVLLNAAISGTVGEQMTAMSGCDMLTLPSGLDLSRARFAGRAERNHIVAIGRVAKHKNLLLLLQAFEILKEGGYAGCLIVAGDGPDMPALRAAVDASPAKADIILRGYISDEEKFDLLGSAQVLAMPSKREGFPHVVSEAMCCGVPVVTADYLQNGTKDVVRTFGAGVVTGSDKEAFADGLREAMSRWDELSANGLRAARSLDWSSIAARLEEAIERKSAAVDVS